MRAEDFRRAVNYARPGSARPKETLPSSNLRSAAPAGARIEFTGSGFGHGVGMCQFGAQSAAERGDGFAQILARYYPGAQVVKAY
jgi:SpoIID/LytB domain protein